MIDTSLFVRFLASPMKLIHTTLVLFSLFAAQSVAQITLNPLPTRVIGQDSVTVNNLNPNLVEGRELDAPQGIALDTSTNPPALYVSDTRNNRVLAFRNAASFGNGQKADLVVGQPDLDTTLPGGPSVSAANATGLTLPSGITVDAQGNLYVVDGGNNRILRYPKPFVQQAPVLPDIVIGQTSFSTNGGNQGGISAATLSFVVSASGGASVLSSYLTFDSSGNLWVADAGNNRMLRFNANVLGSQAASGPSADLVLGQPDFVSNAYNPGNSNAFLSTTAIDVPTGIAFDAAGRLFVSESVSNRRGRVLVWTPPFFIGEAASKILGVDASTPAPPTNSQYQLAQAPGALFPIGTSMAIADTYDNRLLVFPPIEQWVPNQTWQAATTVIGQPDFSSVSANQALPTATASTLNLPVAAVFFGSNLYVADSGNNRVLVMPQNGTTYGPATMVLGQDAMTLNAPNLVEGREFDFQSAAGGADAGVAVDLNSNPPHLYVADTYNNRILGYNDLRDISAGAKADLVIGQPDFQQVLVNYPNNNANMTNASGLNAPTGLVVDASGNLYVADTGNGRVLRFPAPFANYTPGTPEQADLVLGQSNFTATKIPDPTQRTMAEPYGITFSFAGGLLVSDVALNRVLYFGVLPQNLTSGMAATTVFGQQDFNSSGSGSGASQLNAPRHIAVDSDDRLYVADTGNGRVTIYDHAPTADSGPPAAYILTHGLSSPRGVYVNGVNGDIWVADASGVAIRYPAYNMLAAAGGASNAKIQDTGRPLAVVEDLWGNLFLADTINRVLIYYPGLSAINAANFLYPNQLAPGMIASIYSEGNVGQFGTTSASAQAIPLPATLNGVQILFNGSPVPLFFAGTDQINFQVPNSAPQSGTADLQAIEVATGRVLGDTTVQMVEADPGIFTTSGDGIGNAVVLNQDNTLNGPTNQAAQGSTITIFGTGQGFISGAPPDGNISNAPLQSVRGPTVWMGATEVPSANITYSGLAPTLVGVWQIDVVIPDSVISLPSNPTQLIVILDSMYASGGAGIGRDVQIYVKQK